MNQTNLETFIHIANEQSFSRTAEKLNITQPAISKRIASLEQELNTQLIDRIGKTISLTHSGNILLQHATKLLSTIQDCHTAISNTNTHIEGNLNLGVSHHIGLHRLPPLLKLFSNQYPDVQLKIQFIDSEKAYQMIQDGELEIALATLTPTPPANIQQQTVWHDPLSFVVSGDHLLANHQQLDLNTLATHPAILPSPNTHTGQLVQELFESHDCKLHYHIETNYLETVRMMVTIGLGWAILPRTMLNRQLCGLHINNTQLTRQLGYLSHDMRTLSNASKAFLDTLKHTKQTPSKHETNTYHTNNL